LRRSAWSPYRADYEKFGTLVKQIGIKVD